MRSQHQFSQTPSVNIPRSTFNLSHAHKTTFDADYLVPVCQPIDVIPGSTFNFKTSFFMRLATPLEPILDNLHFSTFAFFVPYRTIWVNHEKFHGAQDDPGDSISFTIPVMAHVNGTGTGTGSLWDYFGLPVNAVPDDLPVSALPFRAYNKIFNDWFRSATLQDSIVVDTDNGTDDIHSTLNNLQKRGKRFDYFTSALPAPQRGTAVSLPLGSLAPVIPSVVSRNAYAAGVPSFDTANLTDVDIEATITTGVLDVGAPTSGDTLTWHDPNLDADLANATAANVNDIRLAFATQHILERDARSGTRYVESLKARWGVVSPDFRLQRAEYLGGGSSIVNITPVQQQSAQPTPAADDKLGNLAAYGTASGTHSWSKSFVEHGVIIILGNLRADLTYSQGTDRYWSKSTRYDFVYPEMANIGEQAIVQGEIWHDSATPANDDIVFGYTGRYDEHRFLNSKLTGLMRPDASGTLASWHLSEDFATAPTLGPTFIESSTSVPLDRAIAIPSEPHMIADFYHQIKAALPLPTNGVPGLTRL